MKIIELHGLPALPDRKAASYGSWESTGDFRTAWGPESGRPSGSGSSEDAVMVFAGFGTCGESMEF